MSEQKIGESTGFDDDSDDESDDEEDTEEDRAFIDDDLEEEEHISFYRRVDLELGEQRPLYFANCSCSTTKPFTEKKKTNKLLLTDLHRHVTELVVVGFNSGKYDLNVLKDMLIPYLVNHLGIDLAIKCNHAYLPSELPVSSS